MSKLYPPGTSESGYLAVVVLSELIDTLEAKQVLSKAEVTAMYERIATRLNKSRDAAAKGGAGSIRQALENRAGQR